MFSFLGCKGEREAVAIMGLKEWGNLWKGWLRKNYPAAFSDKGISEATAIIADIMTVIKRPVPPHIRTTGAYKQYIAKFVAGLLRDPSSGNVKTLVLMVDKGSSVIPKRVHCYPTRYRNRKPSADCGHIDLADDSASLPPDWSAFVSNGELVKRELYPLIVLALTDPKYFSPGDREHVFLHGFPFMYQGGNAIAPFREAVTDQWLERDPQTYDRVGVLDCVRPNRFAPPQTRLYPYKQAENRIQEGDLGIAYYVEILHQHPVVIVWINDSDAVPILLLSGYDRRRMKSCPTVIWKMPLVNARKRLEDWEKRSKGNPDHDPTMDPRPADIYVNVDKLYDLIESDSGGPWGKYAGCVQNKCASLAFMMILSGTDFMRGFAKGVGWSSVVLPTFFHNLDVYSHMVMLCKVGERATLLERTPAVDEQLFYDFTLRCYAVKYQKRMESNGTRMHREALSAVSQIGAKKSFYMPGRAAVRIQGRNALWNLAYWLNGHLTPEQFLDPENGKFHPLRSVEGMPYWGYEQPDPEGEPVVSAEIYPLQLDYSEDFAVHMYKRVALDSAAVVASGDRRRQRFERLRERNRVIQLRGDKDDGGTPR